ncbi:hypothetical protein EV363DRAFT_1296480 [Boletus edulis]|nr:hypothetical protein EV363DRAFT_1296480 [Boletus edulis]
MVYGQPDVQTKPHDRNTTITAGGSSADTGNLNVIQTTALFSIATKSLTQSAGVLTGKRQSYGLGSQVQGQVLFGKTQFNSLSLIDACAIRHGYAQVLQSSAKSYLAGYLGTAYIPGHISETEPVFAASIPNLAVMKAEQAADKVMFWGKGKADCTMIRETPQMISRECLLRNVVSLVTLAQPYGQTVNLDNRVERWPSRKSKSSFSPTRM